MKNLEIIYTATDEYHNPQNPRFYGNLLVSHDSFVAVDCSTLQEWNWYVNIRYVNKTF